MPPLWFEDRRTTKDFSILVSPKVSLSRVQEVLPKRANGKKDRLSGRSTTRTTKRTSTRFRVKIIKCRIISRIRKTAHSVESISTPPRRRLIEQYSAISKPATSNSHRSDPTLRNFPIRSQLDATLSSSFDQIPLILFPPRQSLSTISPISSSFQNCPLSLSIRSNPNSPPETSRKNCLGASVMYMRK